MGAFDSLSSKERLIVEFILFGYTVPQIAEKTKYTIQTIKTYKKHIYRKLNVHDKKELFELSKESKS